MMKEVSSAMMGAGTSARACVNMEPRDDKRPFDLLEGKLGADWTAIRTARANAESKRARLRAALVSLDSEDTSIVVFGSLARDEFTSGSDIDWTLLVDGMANPEHFENALAIQRHIEEIEGRPPGREGTFGGLAVCHDLIHKIGGKDDTNRNTTQRILLLLESTAIGRREAYERVVKNVLRRYVDEDFGLVHTKTQYNVPRFLQNDIARYWRTVAVDFAYKQRERGDEQWALRAVKLRLSRKLTYVAGLLMCFGCETDDPRPLPDRSLGAESMLKPIVNHLWKYSQETPLDVLARTILPHPELHSIARNIFDSYNEFLALLDDAEKRQRLENLKRDEVADDADYEFARQLGHAFQSGLTALFLEPNATTLYELTKVYGVF